jgi:hypothetical protein
MPFIEGSDKKNCNLLDINGKHDIIIGCIISSGPTLDSKFDKLADG